MMDLSMVTDYKLPWMIRLLLHIWRSLGPLGELQLLPVPHELLPTAAIALLTEYMDLHNVDTDIPFKVKFPEDLKDWAAAIVREDTEDGLLMS